jgi:pimeloyl-ACP methyl ester carboxylesterase
MSTARDVHVKGHKIVALPFNEEKTNTPVIFIHGVVANIRFWELVQPPILTDELCWYSLSLPGHFPATFPSGFRKEEFTADTVAEVLTGAIQELVGDRAVILAGHSTGGFAALAIAARTPGIAEGVISISGFARGQFTGGLGMLQWLARHGAIGQALFKFNLKNLTINRTVFRTSLSLYAADRQALNSWPLLARSLDANYPYAKQLDANAMLPYFNRLPDIDISTLLPRIAAPTLVLAGSEDPIVPPAQSRSIADRVPNSELLLLDGAGHLLMGERSSDYQRILTDWIRKAT